MAAGELRLSEKVVPLCVMFVRGGFGGLTAEFGLEVFFFLGRRPEGPFFAMAVV